MDRRRLKRDVSIDITHLGGSGGQEGLTRDVVVGITHAGGGGGEWGTD